MTPVTPAGFIGRIRSRSREQRGVTLVELVLAMFVLGLVGAGAVGALTTLNRAALASERSGSATDQAMSALRRLESEVRSGTVVSDPALPDTGCLPAGTPNGCLRMFVTGADGTGRCVEWRLNGQALERRSWLVPSGAPSGWEEAADGIVNGSLSSSVPTFRVDPLSGGRTVAVTLFLQGGSGAAGEPVRFQTSVTARNGGVSPGGSCGLPS